MTVRLVSGNGTHGSHWDCVLTNQDAINDVIAKTVKDEPFAVRRWNGKNIQTGRVQDNEMVGWVSRASGLWAAVLAVNGSIWSAYPVVMSSTSVDAVVDTVARWENEIEAQLVLGVYSARLVAFDPFYFRNSAIIPEHGRMTFAGLVYRAAKATPRDIVSADRKSYSTRGAALLVPWAKGTADDYQFQMPVREFKAGELRGERFFAFSGPLFFGEGNTEKPFDTTVFCLGTRIQGDIPGPGDDLCGSLWLQGTHCLESLKNPAPVSTQGT